MIVKRPGTGKKFPIPGWRRQPSRLSPVSGLPGRDRIGFPRIPVMQFPLPPLVSCPLAIKAGMRGAMNPAVRVRKDATFF